MYCIWSACICACAGTVCGWVCWTAAPALLLDLQSSQLWASWPKNKEFPSIWWLNQVGFKAQRYCVCETQESSLPSHFLREVKCKANRVLKMSFVPLRSRTGIYCFSPGCCFDASSSAVVCLLLHNDHFIGSRHSGEMMQRILFVSCTMCTFHVWVIG